MSNQPILNQNKSTKLFSVVTSLYNSSPYLDEFYKRTYASLKKVTSNYEIIFVDDGSPDDSSDHVKKIIQHDSNVKLIELSKNFGHGPAMFTGISYAKGDYVFIIDVDLEEKPEWIEDFYVAILNDSKNPDVVFGQMRLRKGKIFERLSGTLYYKFFNFLTNDPIPVNQVWARLMTKSYVNALLKYKETNLYPAGVMYLTGYKQIPFQVDKSYKGNTVYSVYKRFSQALNAITSFTSKPLYLISLLGIIVSFVGILLALYFIVMKLFYQRIVPGYTSLIVSLWFLSGIIILSIGIIGIYISKMFIEVKNRPLSIIKNIYPDEKNN